MKPRHFFAGLITAGLAAAPRLAAASVDYPGIVQSDWQLSSAPDCIVCHQSDAGGIGTPTKPFSRSLQREGLVSMDDGSLHKALAAVKAQMIDSDGDNISDYEELRMSSDPNDGPGQMDFPIPETGCALGRGSLGGRGDLEPWLLSCALAGLVRARRKR